MSSVTKTTMEAYRIVAAGGDATIGLRSWQAPAAGGQPPHEQGEIMIFSSFGSWGYRWSNMGAPLKRFLISCSFDYLMGKLCAGNLREFDYTASLENWKNHLKEARRAQLLTADQFNEVFSDSGAAIDSPCGIELFLNRLETSQPLSLRGHPLWDSIEAYVVCRNSPQVVGFWQEIWPEFVQRLRDEMVAINEPRVPAAA